MKYIRSNIGTIVLFLVLGLVTLNPTLKSLVLKGLMKTGLFNVTLNVSEKDSSEQAPSAIFSNASADLVDISSPGGKVIFLNFWATWCPPCIAEMPSVNQLQKKLKHPEAVMFVMVDTDDNMENATAFMEKNKYLLPVYKQLSAVPQSVFDGSLPTTLIIDGQGKIVFRHTGLADYSSKKMVDLINTLTESSLRLQEQRESR